MTVVGNNGLWMNDPRVPFYIGKVQSEWLGTTAELNTICTTGILDGQFIFCICFSPGSFNSITMSNFENSLNERKQNKIYLRISSRER